MILFYFINLNKVGDWMKYRQTIASENDIICARKITRQLAVDLGFNLVDQGRLVICMTELARNILLYAGKGSVKLEVQNQQVNKGIEIVAEDVGPGINDSWLATLDGYSTSNSLGKGLPAVKRLMDEFQLNSKTGAGTIVIIRKWLANNEIRG